MVGLEWIQARDSLRIYTSLLLVTEPNFGTLIDSRIVFFAWHFTYLIWVEIFGHVPSSGVCG
jgi:hypothetical protein